MIQVPACSPRLIPVQFSDPPFLTTLQTCTVEFLNLVASEARQRALKEGRSVVANSDILWSLQTLGFKGSNARHATRESPARLPAQRCTPCRLSTVRIPSCVCRVCRAADGTRD